MRKCVNLRANERAVVSALKEVKSAWILWSAKRNREETNRLYAQAQHVAPAETCVCVCVFIVEIFVSFHFFAYISDGLCIRWVLCGHSLSFTSLTQCFLLNVNLFSAYLLYQI